MASACVNNIGMLPDNFLDCPPATFPSYGWLSPRISFSRDYSEEDKKLASSVSTASSTTTVSSSSTTPGIPNSPVKVERETTVEVKKIADPEVSVKDTTVDFEFRLDDSVTNMLPADELFSDGKLMPLQISSVRPTTTTMSSTIEDSATTATTNSTEGVKLPETTTKTSTTVKSRRSTEDLLSSLGYNDPYLFSPKAPRCSSGWRELLGLKRQNRENNGKTSSTTSNVNGTLSSSSSSPPSSSSSHNSNAKSVRQLLHRSSKSSDSSLILPLLRDSDVESLSISSSRLSLSSSSSAYDHDDLPRLSLDSDKHSSLSHISTSRSSSSGHPQPRSRLVKPRMVSVSENPNQRPLINHPSAPNASRSGRSPMSSLQETTTLSRGVSVDSPRMNSSGKIVFQSLERSSISPSSYGGPRYKHRGMERSYSASVRVTPVLNVPVCSLRGSSKSGGGVFGFFSSQNHKKDGTGTNGTGNGSVNGGSSGRNHHYHHHHHQSGRHSSSAKKVERVEG